MVLVSLCATRATVMMQIFRFIERLDQGHLYPLGERHAGQTCVTGGARTSAPLHRRRPLYLKSYLDSL